MQDKPGGIGHIFRDAGALGKCELGTLVTPDYTALQVCSSGKGLAEIDRSSRGRP